MLGQKWQWRSLGSPPGREKTKRKRETSLEEFALVANEVFGNRFEPDALHVHADMAERAVDDRVGADDESLFVAILRVIPAGQAEIGRHHDHSVLLLLLRVRFLGFLPFIPLR